MPQSFSVGSIYDWSRSLLNDQVGATFTDGVLLPFTQMAVENLRIELQGSNIPLVNKTSPAITITAGKIDVGGDTGPALPNDFIEPMNIWERTAGTTDNYMQMGRRQFLPKIEQITSYLGVWSWQDQIIKFLGANNNIEIKIDYVADTVADINAKASQVKVINSRLFLAFKTAALAAKFIGENPTRAEACNADAGYYLDLMMGISVKSQQRVYTRRRPFMSGYKSRYGGGW